MSVYTFAPLASMNHNHPFVTWQNAFTEEELDELVKYCDDNLQVSKASLGGVNETEDYETIRTSKTGWLSNNLETSWIYDRLGFVGRKINAQFYEFDLYGFVEDMQYTIYEGDDQGHYTWHIDMSETSPSPRKLTLVLQLSDPQDYEGGEIQTLTGPTENSVDKQRGLITAFPSWALHRVTPVTKGIRKTLVVWIAGPQFK